MPALSELRDQILRCHRCGLASSPEHIHYVPGDGPEDARIMFIGEAPGRQENETGSPFVGAAGKFLEEMLSSIGLRRQDVFITNIIKCKPPNNRDPFPVEIEACRHWIDTQLEIIRPRIVVTLGRYSLAKFFPKDSIGKVHGQARRQDGRVYFPLYHPAAALHQGSLRATIEEDFRKLPRVLAEIEKAPEEEGPQQLTMF